MHIFKAVWKMPRRKQQNPQPVKLDSEDGVGTVRPTNLTFESDFLLGQELEFSDPDNDNKIIGLEKFSGAVVSSWKTPWDPAWT